MCCQFEIVFTVIHYFNEIVSLHLLYYYTLHKLIIQNNNAYHPEQIDRKLFIPCRCSLNSEII